jgi:hypothetical protein
MIRGIGKIGSGRLNGIRARGLASRQDAPMRVGTSGSARGTPGCPQLCSSEDPRVGDPVTLEELGRELKGMWESTEVSAAFTVTKMQRTRGDQDFEHGSLNEACKVMTDTCGALRKRRLLTGRRTFAELRTTFVR